MSASRPEGKVTAPLLRARKKSGEKIVALTAYDYPTARLLDESGVDVILVGDSMGNVVLGYPNTLPVTLDDMIHHTRAARRGVTRAMLVADMPFRSVGITEDGSVAAAAEVVAEAGAEAVKVEGASPTTLRSIARILDLGIPVMGHVGLTPQSVHRFGGYKRQGTDAASALAVLRDAKALERAGVFAIVLEALPPDLARRVTQAVSIPTIGIAAGPHCDGQILVFHDLLGLSPEPPPPFVKPYASLAGDVRRAVTKWGADVRSGAYGG